MQTVATIIILAVVASLALGAAMSTWPFKNARLLGGPSLADRVHRYRTAGSSVDGIHTLRGLKIDDLDYALMGADNACAKIAFGENATTGEWFAIDRKSELAKKSFGNSHGSSDDGGRTFYTETAYLEIPKHDCRCPVEEVIWHHRRVTELREQGVERPERIRIMTSERALEPWNARTTAA